MEKENKYVYFVVKNSSGEYYSQGNLGAEWHKDIVTAYKFPESRKKSAHLLAVCANGIVRKVVIKVK